MTFYESTVYCKSRYADFLVSLKAVRMFIETSCECAMYFDYLARCVTDFTYLEKKEHKCLKSLQSSFCILHPTCVLLSVCSLHFTLTLSLHFTPGLQSAVRSLRFTLTVRFEFANMPNSLTMLIHNLEFVFIHKLRAISIIYTPYLSFKPVAVKR